MFTIGWSVSTSGNDQVKAARKYIYTYYEGEISVCSVCVLRQCYKKQKNKVCLTNFCILFNIYRYIYTYSYIHIYIYSYIYTQGCK